MDWHYHNGEAEACGNTILKRYHVKRRVPYDDQLEAWCNGNCMARVDAIAEGIRLCEWVERSGNQ